MSKRKLTLKLMMLATAAWSGAIFATEYRAPLVTEHGPLRYDLYQKKDKWSLETWTTGHYRNADKAFLKHSTEVKQLPALIFGKENFTFAEAFPNAQVNQFFFQDRNNPFLATTVFTPRASYDERGVTLGARFEYPVWNNKGRIGLRTSIPFKTVRMERDDAGESEFGTSLSRAVVKSDTVNMTDGAAAGAVTKNFYPISRYKLSLLANLLRLNADGSVSPAIILGDGTAGNPTKIQGSGDYGRPSNEAALYRSDLLSFVVIKSSDGVPPLNQPTAAAVSADINPAGAVASPAGPITTEDKAIFAALGANNGMRFGTPVANRFSVAGPNANMQSLPSDGSAKGEVGYVFSNNVDYRKLPLNDLWVTPVFDAGGGKPTIPDGSAADTSIKAIDTALQAYQSLGVEEFLFLNSGFEIATNQHTGLGDIDLDLFYEHTFNEDWRGELFAGVRFPTGGGNEFCSNPLNMQLGNGNHFEIKLGANIGFATCDWLNMKAEAYWSFVLEDKEKRSAAFKGATIKNIGPCVDADVNWGHFTGRFDTIWYHPKNDDLAMTVGYEFYYKTKDHVKFKQASSDTFLGQILVDANGDPVVPGAAAPAAPVKFASVPQPLDNKVAEMNTESIAHRVRGELNWKANKYMSLYCGGAFSFAGQNIFREMDMHGGVNVRF